MELSDGDSAEKDGRARFCIDFRRLNSVTEKDAYPLPFIHSILVKLRAAKDFPTLDLRNGYWHVALTDESKPLTVFTVAGRGMYQFRVLLFGYMRHQPPSSAF